MWHRGAALTVISAAVMLAVAAPASAVIKGARSHSLTTYTVRLVGNGSCSAVVIAPRLVVTARHCAYGMSVLADHHYYRVAHVSRDGVLDDGRLVHVSGDASILYLSKPLPETIAAVPVGDGDGDNFIIAGYGGGADSTKPLWWPRAPTPWSIPAAPARSAPAPASAIPAGRCCAAACWSA